ncbi:hypothetical protein C8J57DRAFT_1241071 [Mycena rebaudengoi]|nr:hypothetical protein C8J57DRAFT_1241071 [Mycena rebaudengoi]
MLNVFFTIVLMLPPFLSLLLLIPVDIFGIYKVLKCKIGTWGNTIAACFPFLETWLAPRNSPLARGRHIQNSTRTSRKHAATESSSPTLRPRLKFTAWRIFNTVVVAILGTYKAVSAYQGQTIAPAYLDWILGVIWALMHYHAFRVLTRPSKALNSLVKGIYGGGRPAAPL